MTRYFPAWFFTRPAGFALLLMTIVMADINLSLLRPYTGSGAGLVAVQLSLVAVMIVAVVLVLALWLVEFDEPHDYDDWEQLRWLLYALLAAVAWIFRIGLQNGSSVPALLVIAVSFCVLTRQAGVRSVPNPGERLRGEPRRQAWLVLTIDLRQDPPVAVRAAIFSFPGSQLTSLSALDELNLDVLDASGDSYEQARTEICRLVMLHSPRLVPLLRAAGEDI